MKITTLLINLFAGAALIYCSCEGIGETWGISEDKFVFYLFSLWAGGWLYFQTIHGMVKKFVAKLKKEIE